MRCLLLIIFCALSPIAVFAETSDVSVSVFYAECTDGIDNDSDGLVDYPDDPDCINTGDNNETYVAPKQCSDGLDNDGDGLTDYPDDPGCDDGDDDDESNPVSTPSSDNAASGGGGGRSKAASVKATPTPIQVTISGPASSSGDVVILENGAEKARIPSSGGSRFSKTFTDLTPGLHQFSVYLETGAGNRVLLNNYPVTITENGTYSITDAPAFAVGLEGFEDSPDDTNLIVRASSDKIVVEQKIEGDGPQIIVSGHTEPFAKVSVFIQQKSNQLSQLTSSLVAGVFSLFSRADAQDKKSIMLETVADETGYYEFVLSEEQLGTGEYVAEVEIETMDGVEKHSVDFQMLSTNESTVLNYQESDISTYLRLVTLLVMFVVLSFWTFTVRKKRRL